jgi:glycosyltransferase involved in cell wall biosynthesis
MTEIGVSVLVLAFNHEKYIVDAIEGFINQETTFPYEVIIHEDASTDKTARIIEEYRVKYPNIIKPIYQKENQYSKCININDEHMLPLAKGKYIALCDGDDYWTDSHKLQKQYDAMENNPGCTMCLHKVLDVNENEKNQDMKFIPKKEYATGVISSKEFFDILSTNDFFNEVCYFFRREQYYEYQHNYPLFAQKGMLCKSDDMPMLLYFGQLGDVYYINENLATYRRFNAGSWSEKNKNSSLDYFRNYCTSIIAMFEEFNIFTNNRFISQIERAELYFKFKLCEMDENYKAMVSKEYFDVFSRQSVNYQKRIRLLAKNPKLFGFVLSIFDKVRGKLEES